MPLPRRHRRWPLLLYLLLLVASHLWRHWHPVSPEQVPGRTLVHLGETAVSYSDTSPRADAPPVVLLHGSPMASSCFDGIVPVLARDFRVIALDLPGFGHSRARLDDVSARSHAEAVSALLDYLEIPSAHIVGYSLGGAVGIELERLDPGKVRTLTLLASVGVQEHEMLGDYTLNHAVHGLQYLALAAIQELFPHFGWMDRALLNTAYAKNFFQTDQRPYRETLARFTKAALVVHAEDDFLVPFSAAAEHARIIPHSETAFSASGGHMALMSAPGETAAPIADFLRRASAPGYSPPVATPERLAAARLAPGVRRLGTTALGLLGVMALIALATFVSEDLTCVSAGILVATGALGFLPATAACILGIFVGDLWLYALGRSVGTRAAARAPLRWFLPEKRLAFGRDWFEAHAASLIFASRFLPGTRLPLYFSAGVARVRPRRFLFWFMLAALVWSPLLVGAAALVGKPLLAWFARFEEHALAGFLVLSAAVYLFFQLVVPLFTWKGRRLLLGKWRRLTRWEFWPMATFYPPVLLHVLWLAARYRSPTLFTAANPGIPCGGLVGESKLEILRALEPSGAVARFAKAASTVAIGDQGFTYPLALKPDTGERGQGVAIVRDAAAAEAYLASAPEGQETIAQEFVPGVEYGVFYLRYPGEPRGRIFSVTEKRLTSVTGDGTSTLERLILSDDRAVCMAPFFLESHSPRLHEVPGAGETVPLTDLGTHCRGALFLDASHLATPALASEIERISRHFDGFYFGRYDLRAPSEEDFRAGHNLKILELNGVTSEATHIYDPRHGLLHAYRTLREQWGHCFAIAQGNTTAGHRPATLREICARLRDHRSREHFEAP